MIYMGARFRRLPALFILLIGLTISSRTAAQAADQLLFNVLVNDGYTEKTVPVYAYDSGKVKAQKGLRTIYVNRQATVINFLVTDYTEYFRTMYKSVVKPREVLLLDTNKAEFTLKGVNGFDKTFKIKFKTPPKPKITKIKLNKKSYKPGSGNLKITVTDAVKEEVSCIIQVINSKKKVVYSADAGTGEKTSFSAVWDGTVSADNTAGLEAGTYAPKGKYKVRVYLKYKNGDKTKKVKKTYSFKVKKAAAVKTVKPAKVPEFTKTWPWKMMVTGNKKVDYLAEAICQEILTPGMSEYERVKAIYAWCVMHFTRSGGKVSAATTAYKYDITSAEAKAAMKAYQKKVKAMISAGTAVINIVDSAAPSGGGSGWMNKRIQGLGKQVGDCTHAAAMFEALCRHAGIDCDLIENSLPYSNIQHHVWNVTKVDGKWYYCDARMENARLYGRKTVLYTFLLKGKKVLAKKEARYGKIKNKKEYKALYKLVSDKDYKK